MWVDLGREDDFTLDVSGAELGKCSHVEEVHISHQCLKDEVQTWTFLSSVCPDMGKREKLWWGSGFPDSSVGKESACNAGDPNLILGSGRFTGKGIGYLLQYCWAPLVAQLLENLPAMRKTWVRSLGWEDSLENG